MKPSLPFALLFSFFLLIAGCKRQQAASETADEDTIPLTTVKFNADSAYASIVKQCSFGARVPGTPAHAQCADYIIKEFRALGLSVQEQKATVRTYKNEPQAMRNVIASYKPEAAERIVIAAHWESRPWADADPDSSKHHQPVMAANDGASGVAVMLEIARLLPALKPEIGIDFICFDAEDGGAPYWDEALAPADGSDWCLGAQYWAAHPHTPNYTARYGVLLDMVGGSDARFCYEGVSKRYASSVMLRIWDAAQRVGAGNFFIQQDGGWAQDDHVAMNEVAGIPTVDIIPCVEGEKPFGVTWHTTSDTPENISKETLRAVGQTLLQFISEEKQ